MAHSIISLILCLQILQMLHLTLVVGNMLLVDSQPVLKLMESTIMIKELIIFTKHKLETH
jgi:hypothetical protein